MKMFTKKEMCQLLVEILRELADGYSPSQLYVNGKDHEGLCFITRDFCSETNWLDEYFKSWPHFSGRIVFPVPDPHDPLNIFKSAAPKYTSTENKWADTDYGDLRRDLAEYLADCIEEDFAEFLR